MRLKQKITIVTLTSHIVYKSLSSDEMITVNSEIFTRFYFREGKYWVILNAVFRPLIILSSFKIYIFKKNLS